MFIDNSSAIVSHLAAMDRAAAVIAPLISIGALVGSWHLRPASRRLPNTPSRGVSASHLKTP
jgi:hypothetical protein